MGQVEQVNKQLQAAQEVQAVLEAEVEEEKAARVQAEGNARVSREAEQRAQAAAASAEEARRQLEVSHAASRGRALEAAREAAAKAVATVTQLEGGAARSEAGVPASGHAMHAPPGVQGSGARPGPMGGVRPTEPASWPVW